MDDLTLVTTTDSAAVAAAAIENNEQATRVQEEPLLPEEKYKAPGNTITISYNHPRSERTQLLERLQQAEHELEQLSESETVTTNEAAKAEQQESAEAPAGQPEAQSDDVLKGIRERAMADAARDARVRMGLEPSAQTQLQNETARLLGSFQARFEAIKPPDLEKLVTAVRANNVDIPAAAHEALISIPGGPEAFVHLLRNPEEIKKLSGMSGHVQAAYVAQLAARMTQPKRPVSNAPAPIRPVSGSSTTSSVPLSEADYQTYKRVPNEQERNRYRR